MRIVSSQVERLYHDVAQTRDSDYLGQFLFVRFTSIGFECLRAFCKHVKKASCRCGQSGNVPPCIVGRERFTCLLDKMEGLGIIIVLSLLVGWLRRGQLQLMFLEELGGLERVHTHNVVNFVRGAPATVRRIAPTEKDP